MNIDNQLIGLDDTSARLANRIADLVRPYDSELSDRMGVQIKFLQNKYGKNMPADDFANLIITLAQKRIDPMNNEVSVIPFNGRSGKTEFTIIVGKNYHLKVAQSKKTFNGFKAGVILYNQQTGELIYREGSLVIGDKELLVGGWAEVYDSGVDRPFRSEVSLAEYNTKKSIWNTHTATMIRKVALVHSLREAYNSDLSVYAPEEVREQDYIEIESEEIKEEKENEFMPKAKE
jgi:phage recombination protein Bet